MNQKHIFFRNLYLTHINKMNFDIRIDRSSKYGNPFKIGIDGSREEVIYKYEQYIIENNMINDLFSLKCKILGCWCYPKLCHGDVLIKYIYETGENLKCLLQNHQ